MVRTTLVCSIIAVLIGGAAPHARAAPSKYQSIATDATAVWVEERPGERIVITMEFGSRGEVIEPESYDEAGVRITVDHYACRPGCALVGSTVDESYEGTAAYARRFDRLEYWVQLENDEVVEAVFTGDRITAKSTQTGGRCPRVRVEEYQWSASAVATIDGSSLGATRQASSWGSRTTHLANNC